MTAMVAHPSALWPQDHRRPGQVMTMPPASMQAMIPTTHSQASRSYQTSPIELSMPMYGATSMAPSMNFPSTAYGFDLTSMNHYSVQQPLGFGYQPQMQHAPGFSQGPSEMSPAVTVTDVRSNISQVQRSPSVKVEPSPVEGIQPQVYPLSVEETAPAATTEATETPGGVAFNTDIDCLMRTIQTKSKTASTPTQQEQAPAPIQQSSTSESKTPKTRKRYQCSMPDCNKSFYQKTHLEIHTRAHTGVKPFVCKEAGCGQRFSQLGNLKASLRIIGVMLACSDPCHRRTRDDILASAPTTATSVANPSRSVVMYARIGLCINRSSLSPASLMTAESSLPSLAISR